MASDDGSCTSKLMDVITELAKREVNDESVPP
jgi:hypothetical protein